MPGIRQAFNFSCAATHTWLKAKHGKNDRLLLNLPRIAYVFDPQRPNGRVAARISAELELRALNPAHDEHGRKHVIEFA